MQYRIDKKSGDKLPILGFGCMRFPDRRKAEEMVMRALEAGLNYFDTAWAYPGSEETLGAILEKNRAREKALVATKLPLFLLKGPADFDKYFFQSLKRLKTGYIDYYLMHMITDMDQWEKLKSWGIESWIAAKKQAGQIRRSAFSFHGSRAEFLKVLDDYDWELCQIQYNYSDENFQAGVTGLKRAAEKMPVVIMEPLLGGKLATGLPKEAAAIFKKANPNLSPAAWGLNWVWNQPEAAIVLSGMSSMEQLEENLRLADKAGAGMLGETEMDVYRRALAVIKRSYKIPCTGCNYCMPCPRGVNIPGCFAAYNTSYSMGYYKGLHQFITSTALTSERSGSPGQCVQCGKCESHCPQNIPIVKHLGEVRRRLEPWWLRFAGACVRGFTGKKRKKTSHFLRDSRASVRFLILILLIVLSGCAKGQTDGRALVAVSIVPQEWFVSRIGGERVRTLALAGQGQNPHNYEPTPRQIQGLAGAGAWLLSGAEFEITLRPKVEKLFPALPIVNGAEGVVLRRLDEAHDDDGGGHGPGEFDRHTWLGREPAKILAGHVKETLAALDPAGAAFFADNYDRLIREIDGEFDLLRRDLAPLRGSNIFVYHPSFGYFLDEFEIRQQAVETGGKTPGPRELSRLIALAKQERPAAIFVQAQFPVSAAKTVADAVGAVTVSLDPLAPDWLANIRRMGDALLESARR